MYKIDGNNVTKLSPIGVTGNGTPTLTIQYNTTLGPTDWVAFVYEGTSASNAFRDAAGNVLKDDHEGEGVFVLGGSGNNTIDLSADPDPDESIYEI